MAPFDQISGGFKAFAQQRLNSLEQEVNNTAAYESDIDDLEASLKQGVEETKKDLNDRIDEVQNAITSRRPHPSDWDYARKRAQYVELLNESVNGMDLLKAWLQNIFHQLKNIVMSIVSWIVNRIVGVARRIKDAFKSLFHIFF